MSRFREQPDLPIPRNPFVNPRLNRLSKQPTGIKSGTSLAPSPRSKQQPLSTTAAQHIRRRSSSRPFQKAKEILYEANDGYRSFLLIAAAMKERNHEDESVPFAREFFSNFTWLRRCGASVGGNGVARNRKRGPQRNFAFLIPFQLRIGISGQNTLGNEGR
jgi:hypothetical protein